MSNPQPIVTRDGQSLEFYREGDALFVRVTSPRDPGAVPVLEVERGDKRNERVYAQYGRYIAQFKAQGAPAPAAAPAPKVEKAKAKATGSRSKR